MKAWRAGEENLHSFLTSTLNKLQALAALAPEKNHDMKLVRGWLGPVDGLEVLEKIQIFCLLWNSNIGPSSLTRKEIYLLLKQKAV